MPSLPSGLRLAIDDFPGTGYSSLASLASDCILARMDRSFVQLLDEDSERANPIIATILHLAESLGLDVVAEGIETERLGAPTSRTAPLRTARLPVHRPMPFGALRSFVTAQPSENVAVGP
ncbi:MAG: EAL domain-containing protein [Acidimicrobiales bacterium]